MEKILSNEELIKYIQGKIIERGQKPYYPVEQHLQDMDLIADLEMLKLKYRKLRSDTAEDMILKMAEIVREKRRLKEQVMMPEDENERLEEYIKDQKSGWISDNPRDFDAGDIICDKAKQDFLRLVVYADDNALWCVGLVRCALTENCENHPIFPMYFDEIERGVYRPLLRLGNLKDYSNYINDVHMEVLNKVMKE